MTLSCSFFLVVQLCYHVLAGVIHDGVDINAKIPTPFPIPGTELEDELFAINTNHARNETARRSVIDTQNVTVRIPFLSVQYTNSSEVPKSVLAKDATSILGQPLSLLPKGSELDEVVEHLDIPVRVAELASLAATAESPEQFREKFLSSSLLENILSDIEDKSKYYNEITNLLNQGPSTLTTTPTTKKRRAKRQAIFSVEQNIDGPTVMVMHQPESNVPEQDIDYAAFFNYTTNDDGTLGKSLSSSGKDKYTPEARLLLPRLLRLLTHPPVRRPASPSTRLHPSHRPILLPRPSIIRPIIRPLVSPTKLLPIVRAFADPTVIRSLLQAIPQIPPIVAPRGDQIVHPPITSYPSPELEPVIPMYDEMKPTADLYGYEEPPADSEFDVPRRPPLSPFVDSFSTLLHDFSITR